MNSFNHFSCFSRIFFFLKYCTPNLHFKGFEVTVLNNLQLIMLIVACKQYLPLIQKKYFGYITGGNGSIRGNSQLKRQTSF